MQTEELPNNIHLMESIQALTYHSPSLLKPKIELFQFSSQCLYLHQVLTVHKEDKLSYRSKNRRAIGIYRKNCGRSIRSLYTALKTAELNIESLETAVESSKDALDATRLVMN